jgi:hypothetical protein
MTNVGKGASDDNSVKAGNDPGDLILVELYKRVHDLLSYRRDSTEAPEYDNLLVPATPG